MEIFREHHRTQKAYIERELAEFEDTHDLHDIFQQAIDAIQAKIENAEDFSEETDLAFWQLREIRKLLELFNEDYLTQSLTRTSNISIGQSFRRILDLIEQDNDLDGVSESIEGMIDAELDRLADTFVANTFRDKVESSIDFKWSIRENYYESSAMTDFLLEFTVAYVDFLEAYSGVTVEPGDYPDDLVLDEDSLRVILSTTLLAVKKNNQEYYDDLLGYDIGFSLDGIGEVEINISDFAEGLESDISGESTPDIQVDGASDEVYEVPEVPTGVADSGQDNTEIILDVDISTSSGEGGEETDTGYLEMEDTSPGNILSEYNQGNITWTQAIELLEGDSGFQEDRNGGYSYGDALHEFGFGESLTADINTIFRKELNESELNNVLLMTRYFLYVESSGGYNVSNYEGVSTAKGYFQYLTGNGNAYREALINGEWIRQGDWNDDNHTESPTVRRFWGTNSYETALGHIPEGINDRAIFSAEIEKIGNPNVQDPRDLSAQDQTILFLSDLLERSGAKNISEQMLEGDVTAVEELYRLHHTDTDEATEFRMLLAGREIYGIPIETYTRSGNDIVGLVLPEANITNFLMGLIREINPNTSIEQSEVMQSLIALGNIPFQAGSRITISRSSQDGVAYTLTLNGEDYLQINADKTFIYLG